MYAGKNFRTVVMRMLKVHHKRSRRDWLVTFYCVFKMKQFLVVIRNHTCQSWECYDTIGNFPQRGKCFHRVC